MATYDNDLRLKEITTGDESGTWGTSTNTNLELIAEAFSYGTEASFSSDADATTTIADGLTDPARSLYFKVTSGVSLTATRTLTIAPNDVSKIWIIENATSGSQSINISQGSGANITIPAGDTKVVYSDGAGAGAAFFDAFAGLKVTDPAQTNITSVGTLTGLTITAATPSIQMTDSDNNADAYIQATDGNLRFYADDSAEAADSIVTFNIDGGEKMRIDSSGDVGIGTSSPAGLLHLSETADGTKLRITKGGLCEWDFSIGNTSTLTGVGAGALELLPLNAGTTNEFAIGTAGTTAPLFHLKNDQNYFAQKVGIGTTTPGSFDAEANNLVVGSGSGDEGITIFTGSSVGDYGSIFFGDATGTPKQGQIRYEQNNEVMSFYTNTSEKMRIDLNGSVLIGTSTTPTYAHKLVVAGSSIPDGIAAIEDDDVSVGLANAILRLTFSQDSECTSGYVIYMTDANNVIGSVTVASGTTVNYNTSSDERLKENIVDASSQLNTIKNIKVREFDWKKGGHHQVGLIAQELQTLIPDVVSLGGDDEAKNPYGVDYGKLTPYIVKAMQEQQTIIESLTARITTLEG
jgi:hypothetical protein